MLKGTHLHCSLCSRVYNAGTIWQEMKTWNEGICSWNLTPNTHTQPSLPKFMIFLSKSLISMVSSQCFSAPEAFQEWAQLSTTSASETWFSLLMIWLKLWAFINVTKEMVKPRVLEADWAVISSWWLIIFQIFEADQWSGGHCVSRGLRFYHGKHSS